MQNNQMSGDWWTIELEGMPQFEMAMRRVYAWYENEIIDRAPIRFQAHNAFLNAASEEIANLPPAEKKRWWFNVELQVDLFAQTIEGRRFHGETFPVYFPNLGPEVYAAFYGTELVYGEVTSWAEPLVKTWDDIESIQLDMNNEYFHTLDNLTEHAIERGKGKFLTGYTDLHPGLDCVAAWRDPQQLCFDLIENPDKVALMAELAIVDFRQIYDHFDAILKRAGQLSVSWMGIPSFGTMHIPSCDFSALISPALFERFGLPILQREVSAITHNIFHLDGPGIKKHLDAILSVPEIHAIQWVQGMGNLYPILQWLPFLKELQSRNVPVVVDLSKEDLDSFMREMDPKGLFLWVATKNEEEELEILKKIEIWK
jgi:hypothetical protein